LALALAIAIPALGGCATSPKGIETRGVTEVERLRERSDHAEGAVARQSGDALEPLPQPALPEEVAAPQPRPAWVTRGQSIHYPLSHFIVGVGSSSEADTSAHAAIRIAEDRARNAIAKQIKVRIRSEFESAAEIVTKTQAGKTHIEKNQSSVADRINSQADLQLEGAAIVGRWYDEKDRTHWAFAALDRSITAAAILDRITALRQRMIQDRQLGTTLREEGRTYQALRRFRKALDASLGLLNYRAQLRVIAPAAAAEATSAFAEDANFAGLWKDIAETTQTLRAGMILFADVEGRPRASAAARTELSAALQGIGFNLSNHSPALAELSYDALREMPPAEIHELAGEKLNCLLLAKISARHEASEAIGRLTVHFYNARAELLFIDLDAGTVAASVGFDYSPATYTGNKDRTRAAEESLSKASHELSARFKRELETQN